MDIERAKKMNSMIKELSQHRSVFGGHDDCVDYVKKMYGDLSPSLVLEEEHPAPPAESYQSDYATLSLVDRKLRIALTEQQQLFEAALMKLGEQLTEFISQHQTEVAELKKLVAAAPFTRSSIVEQEIKRELRQEAPKQEPRIAAQVVVQERLEQPRQEIQIESLKGEVPKPEAPKQYAPRCGSFTPADVSVEKFFYCGTK